MKNCIKNSIDYLHDKLIVVIKAYDIGYIHVAVLYHFCCVLIDCTVYFMCRAIKEWWTVENTLWKLLGMMFQELWNWYSALRFYVKY